MAEELTRSLRTLSERGTPRGASDVLESARHDAFDESAPRWMSRPIGVAVAAFVATLVVLGGSLALVAALRRPTLDAGANSLPEAIGDVAAANPTSWLLIPAVAAGAAVVALVVRNRQERSRKETPMTTTTETTSAEQLGTVKRNNRWLVWAVVVLAAALAALGAWVMYDLASEPETGATGDINALYDDYTAAWNDGDYEAFRVLTTEDYTFTSLGETRSQVQQSLALSPTAAQNFQVERVGDLVVMGEGPEYYVAVAERLTYLRAEYVGVSAYRMVETEAGLLVAEHTWVGSF